MNVEDERESLEISFTVQPIVNNRNVKKNRSPTITAALTFMRKQNLFFFLFHLQIYFFVVGHFYYIEKIVLSKEILMC